MIAVNKCFTDIGFFPSEIFLWLTKSATATSPPILSEGWPHSAANQVSLKSSQRIMVPILKAAWIGSSKNGVPGTLEPFGTKVPGMMGPRSLVHSLKRRDKIAQPIASARQRRAVW